MTYIADLAPWTYQGPAYEVLCAVGWLDAEHPFLQGSVDSAILAKLAELASCPWEPGHYYGFHNCELCPPGSAPNAVYITIAGRHLTLGASNLFIPDRRRVYVAPSLILHYIVSHGYQPPQVFLDAVRQCPPMWSAQYEIWVRVGAPGLFNDPEVWPPYNRSWHPSGPVCLDNPDDPVDHPPSRWARSLCSCQRWYYILTFPRA